MIEYIILFVLIVSFTAAGYFIAIAGTKETTYEEAKGTQKSKGKAERKENRSPKNSMSKPLKKQKEPEKVSLASNIVKEALSNYKKPQPSKSHGKEAVSSIMQVKSKAVDDKNKPTANVKTKSDAIVKAKPILKQKPAAVVEKSSIETSATGSNKEISGSSVTQKENSGSFVSKKEKSATVKKEKAVVNKKVIHAVSKETGDNKKIIPVVSKENLSANKKVFPAPVVIKENASINKKIVPAPVVNKEIASVNKKVVAAPVSKENPVSKTGNLGINKKEKVLSKAENVKSKFVKKQPEIIAQNSTDKVDNSNNEPKQIVIVTSKSKKSQKKGKLNGDMPQIVEKTIIVEKALENVNNKTKSTSNKKLVSASNKSKNVQLPEVSSGEEQQIMIIAQQMQEARKSAESKMKKPKEKSVVVDTEINSLNTILSSIQGARLKSAEIQIMIDLLLNRQNESNIKGGEWVEMGKIDPLTQLRKQLDEAEKRLREENESKISLSEKIVSLRTDVKGEKINNTNLKKQLEQASTFMQQKLQETVQASNEQLNLKMKELNVSLERNFQTQIMQQKQTLQVEYEGQLQHINAIHAETEQQLQQYCHNQTELDMQLQKGRATLAEYEQRMQSLEAAYNETDKQCQVAVQGRDEMAQTCQQYQQHIASLTDQSSQKEAALSRQLHDLQSNLKASENARTQALTQYSQVTGEREQLMQQIANFESIRELFPQTQNKLQIAINDNVELESRFNKVDNELSNVREIAKNQMIKIDELQKEKEELATQAFRPAGDGQENGDSTEKKENIANNLSAMYEENISSLANEITKLKVTLETQQSKCKEKVASYEEEWQNMRDSLGRIFPTILQVSVDDKPALVKKVEEETKKVAERKPEVIEKVVKIPEEDGEKYKKLQEENEDLVNQIKNLETEKASLCGKLADISTAPKPVDNSAKLAELTEENKTLNEKVTNYMSVLANTESLLESLQVSVEKEEKSWKEKMAEKDVEVKQLSAEKSNLLVKIDELNATEKTDESSEISCLKARLQKEQEQNQKLSSQLESQSQNSTIPEAVNANGSQNGIESHEGKFSPEDSTSLLSSSSVSEVVGSTAESSSSNDSKKKKKRK